MCLPIREAYPIFFFWLRNRTLKVKFDTCRYPKSVWTEFLPHHLRKKTYPLLKTVSLPLSLNLIYLNSDNIHNFVGCFVDNSLGVSVCKVEFRKTKKFSMSQAHPDPTLVLLESEELWNNKVSLNWLLFFWQISTMKKKYSLRKKLDLVLNPRDGGLMSQIVP